MRFTRTSLILAFFCLLTAATCGIPKKTDTTIQGTSSTAKIDVSSDEASEGLTVRLESGTPEKDRNEQEAAVKAVKLDEKVTAKILTRLKEIAVKKSDVLAFFKRQGSLPAPRTGDTVKGTFPPAGTQSTVETQDPGDLEVLRFGPDGDVPITGTLSVSFSQPMVELTSHKDSIAKGVPVKLTPAVEGNWRWVGTKTLLFEPKPRFAMATHYAVEIPAGTRSALGKPLKEAVNWKFSTPPPQVKQTGPQGSGNKLDPMLVIRFDQPIDKKEVLKKTSIRCGEETFRLRLASVAEIRDELNTDYDPKEDEHADRWVGLKIDKPLPKAARAVVTLAEGIPSKEGPRVTETPHTFSFRTYDPLKARRVRCWGGCRPGAVIVAQFNNTLATKDVSPSWVKVTPAIKGLRVEASGNNLYLSGDLKGMQTYEVVLDKNIKDMYGQILGESSSHSVEVGPARPQLFNITDNFIVIDPSAKPTYPVHSLNHKRLWVRMYSVGPKNYQAFKDYQRRGMNEKKQASPPGQLKFEKLIEVDGGENELNETLVDLTPALEDGLGQVLLWVSEEHLAERSWKRQQFVTWIQSTKLAVDAVADRSDLIAWVNQLETGSPVKGARVVLWPGSKQELTNAKGLASMTLPAKREDAQMLIASKGKDLVMLPKSTGYWSESGWSRGIQNPTLIWHVLDDRKLYRPGEEVRVKGWTRVVHWGKGGGISPAPSTFKDLTYEVFDVRGNKVASGKTNVGELGAFHLKFKLKDTMNLGSSRIVLKGRNVKMAGGQHTHTFKVQEFRRPEFEVNVSANEGPHLVGGSGLFLAKAAYFSGGPLAGAETHWNVSVRQGHFRPKGHEEYTFGFWTPWWDKSANYKAPARHSFTGKTDALGNNRLRVHFDAVNPPRPMSVVARASVEDINRQSWTGTSSVVVHPSNYYVGMKTDRYFVKRGDPLKVSVIVADLDGNPVNGAETTVEAVRVVRQWKRDENGSWKMETSRKDPQSCSFTSTTKAGVCKFKTSVGGEYDIVALVKDTKGRPNQSRMMRWVSGAKAPVKRKIEQEQVTLIPDKKVYEPGDVAEILIQSPIESAEALITIRRGGVLSKERIRMKGSSHVVKVPVAKEHIPNLAVQVNLVGTSDRLDADGKKDSSLPPRPAFAKGFLSLTVSKAQHELTVTVEPEKSELEPGGQTKVRVTLKGADGKPVKGGEAILIVVDEAILALTGYNLRNPLHVFYPSRDTRTMDNHVRSFVWLADPDALRKASEAMGDVDSMAEAEDSAGGVSAAPVSRSARPKKPKSGRARKESKRKAKPGSSGDTPIDIRSDFRALAYYAPSLRTDAKGSVEVDIKLPDNLTRYRVMAVAVAGHEKYGIGESDIKARLPLMVRPSPPRFLNFGDAFELPIVVQNQTDAPRTVDVAVRSSNVELVDGAGRQVHLKAGGRTEVRFPMRAQEAGRARFQVAVVSDGWSDAAEFSMPVYTPATTEAFATYGTVDKGAVVQPMKMPEGVFSAFGGVEITTSSTALQALTDAVLYLVSYRFECSEQLSSRILAVAALKDVLGAFKAKAMPSEAAILAAVKRDLKKLERLQNTDGGFSFWKRYDESWPFLSIHVGHALVRAKAKGFTVPEAMLSNVLRYLRAVEQHTPNWYHPTTKRTISAYALYVRALNGDVDLKKARKIVREAGGISSLPLESVAWLYTVFHMADGADAERKEIRKLLRNRVSEEAATAHFVTSYTDGAHLILHSRRRVDGLLLEALILDQPKSDLIPKLVRGLLDHRTRGRWGNTQENAFVLLALDRYFNTYEKTTPDFIARAWLGDQYAGEHKFKGRTTERHHIDIPMSYLAEQKSANLVLEKKGKGRMYYRLGLRYAPTDLKPPPAEHGFHVERTYEAVDDPSDVRLDASGSWQVKAGARVRVKVTMAAAGRRYHVALVDWLPAGLEPVNADLRGSEPVPEEVSPRRRGRRGPMRMGHRGYYPRWRSYWYDHQNLRDERAEAFTSLLWGGVYTYSYVAKATTPGTFVVPPAKAEEMYHPETFGRSAGDRMIIK